MYKANRALATAGLMLFLTAAAGAAIAPSAAPAVSAAAAKTVSAPPTGSGSESLLSWDGSSKLTWQHYHKGDYNQDGEVNGADFIRIASHMLMTMSDPGWAGVSMIDGDENGEINIADMTPMALNFKTECASYNIYHGASGSGPWVPMGNVLFSAHLGNPLTDRISFEYTPATFSGEWFYVVHVDSTGTEGAQSNIIGPL